MMRHTENAHFLTGPASGVNRAAFLFCGAGHTDQYSNCLLGRMY